MVTIGWLSGRLAAEPRGAGIAEVPHRALRIGEPEVVRRDARRGMTAAASGAPCWRRPRTRRPARGRGPSARPGLTRATAVTKMPAGVPSRAGGGGRRGAIPRRARPGHRRRPGFPIAMRPGWAGRFGRQLRCGRAPKAVAADSAGGRSGLDQELVAERGRRGRQREGPCAGGDDHLGAARADVHLGGAQKELLL